jgi:hypothetical protein
MNIPTKSFVEFQKNKLRLDIVKKMPFVYPNFCLMSHARESVDRFNCYFNQTLPDKASFLNEIKIGLFFMQHI